MLLFLHSLDKIVGIQVENLNFCSENVQNKNSQEKSKKVLTNEKSMIYYSQGQRKSKSNKKMDRRLSPRIRWKAQLLKSARL